MKIHYPKFFKVIISLFSVLFTLRLAKFLGFDFALDLRYFFLIFLIPLSIFLVFEIFANRKIIKRYLESQASQKKTEVDLRAKKYQNGIIKRLPYLSRGLFCNLTLFIGYLIAYSFTFFKLLGETLFSRYLFLALAFFGILFEIIYLPVSIDSILIILILIWAITVYRFKLKGEFSIKVALILLPLCPFLLSRKQDFLAEKVAVWVFLFLVVGVLGMVWEGRKQIDSSL